MKALAGWRGGMALRWMPALSAVLLGMALAGCGSPSKANIELRKEKQALQARIDQLEVQHSGDVARIEGLENKVGTVPTLSEAKLDTMFTVHQVELGRLSGGADLEADRPGDEGFKAYVTPLDGAGDVIKATGDLEVQAFDLSASPPILLGECHYDAAAMKDLWRSFGPIHAFVAECPWQTAPRHEAVSLRVTFRDALTQRQFTVLKDVEVKLGGGPSGAATRP